MTSYVVDTYAWIEYFRGSEKGRTVRRIIEDPRHEISTNILNLSELVSVIRRNGEDEREAVGQALALSRVCPVDVDFACLAGALHADIRKTIKDFGLIDAFVLATARKLEAKILTGDPHFKGFKESVMI